VCGSSGLARWTAGPLLRSARACRLALQSVEGTIGGQLLEEAQTTLRASQMPHRDARLFARTEPQREYQILSPQLRGIESSVDGPLE